MVSVIRTTSSVILVHTLVLDELAYLVDPSTHIIFFCYQDTRAVIEHISEQTPAWVSLHLAFSYVIVFLVFSANKFFNCSVACTNIEPLMAFSEGGMEEKGRRNSYTWRRKEGKTNLNST